MKRVLIVEDHNELLTLLSEQMSEMFDVTVVCTRSGNEALEILSADGAFDLIVCDYHMPNGDGREVFNHIQKDNNPTPFILYTGCILIPCFEGKNFLGTIAKPSFQPLFDLSQQVLDRRKHDTSV
ncbi:MAG: response regulator [Pseudobdellovibrionaceae bacterium]